MASRLQWRFHTALAFYDTPNGLLILIIWPLDE
jgi:hypothetical protein